MYEADLNELATMTRIPRAVLLREAVDDLLEKHRVIWSRSRITACHRAAFTGRLLSPVSSSDGANCLRHDHASARDGPL